MRTTSHSRTRRSITLQAQEDQALAQTLERLRAEVAELRASRERLVKGADDDRRTIERALHEGVQQHLVALSVNLQLAKSSAADPAAARALLEEMEGDVQHALDEAAQLAQRIYAPLLEIGGLAAALRSAAVSAGVPASVDVSAGSSYRPEMARTILLCWLATLENHEGEAPTTISVRDGDEALAFEIVGSAARSETAFVRLRDRVEALGGRLTIRSERAKESRVSVTLPLSR
jgi:signal transduction histidine kinase